MRNQARAIWYVLLGRGVMYRMHVRVPAITFLQTPQQALVEECHIEVVGSANVIYGNRLTNVAPAPPEVSP